MATLYTSLVLMMAKLLLLLLLLTCSTPFTFMFGMM